MSKISSLKKYKGYFHKNTRFSISEERYNIDIDYPQDLDYARSQINRFKNNS